MIPYYNYYNLQISKKASNLIEKLDFLLFLREWLEVSDNKRDFAARCIKMLQYYKHVVKSCKMHGYFRKSGFKPKNLYGIALDDHILEHT